MYGLIIRHVFSFCFSALLSYYLIPLIIGSAKKLNFLDKPDGRIKVHEVPIPHLGGITIYMAFIATLALSYPFENIILWLLLGITFLLFVGFIDDLKILKPKQKLFGQFIAVLCFLKGGFSLKANFLSSSFNLFISGFWMLSVINAFNLVDVMDGLSSLLAIIAAITFFIIALMFKQYAISILLLAFLGALCSFFVHNKPPAKIYLGDAGALFIGGFLSAVPLLFSWSQHAFDAYYAPIIILGVPLLEVFFLVIIRARLGIPFYWGSPHHFSIYLQNKGWSKYGVLFFAGSMSVFLSLTALLFLLNVLPVWGLFPMGIGFCSLWCYIVFGGSLQKQVRKKFSCGGSCDTVCPARSVTFAAKKQDNSE